LPPTPGVISRASPRVLRYPRRNLPIVTDQGSKKTHLLSHKIIKSAMLVLPAHIYFPTTTNESTVLVDIHLESITYY